MRKRTLHVAYRVSDLDRSLRFYSAVGYVEIGRVSPRAGWTLVMLKLPDDEFVTLELVREEDLALSVGTGFSHLVVQVDDLEATCDALREQGITPEQIEVHGDPDVEDVTKTSFLFDPDGYRIELVQWPDGHADGLTEADWAG